MLRKSFLGERITQDLHTYRSEPAIHRLTPIVPRLKALWQIESQPAADLAQVGYFSVTAFNPQSIFHLRGMRMIIFGLTDLCIK